MPAAFLTVYGWFAMQMFASRWTNDSTLLAPLAILITAAIYFIIDRVWIGAGIRGTLARAMVIAFVSMILLAIEIPSGLTIGQRARQKETIRRMRVIVAALDDYAQKHGGYPNAETVRAVGSSLPSTDDWGHPLALHSRATDYSLTSYGLGGRAYAQPEDGPTTHPEDDIIVRNGRFVRYPEGMQPQ